MLREPGAFEGYTLYAPLLSKITHLIDLDGKVVHQWTSEYPPGNSVFLRDDGSLLRCGRMEDNPVFAGGGIGGRVQEFAWDGTLLWDYVFSNEEHISHHDIAPLANGNVLLIVWEVLPRDDALALGRDPAHLGANGLWPDAVFEVKPVRPSGGEIVWEWHSWDHLIQDLDPSKPYYGSVHDHPERIDINVDHRDRPALSEAELAELRERESQMRALGYGGGEEEEEEAVAPGPDGAGNPPPPPEARADWLHTNSIDYDPANDWILLSTPRLSEIWIIDHSTTTEEAAGSLGGRWGKGGDLLYRWGNPKNYGAGKKEDQRLYAQHQPHWISPGLPGAGHVLVFNNGEGRPDGDYSSVDEIVLPVDPARGFLLELGAKFGPEAPLWSYSASDKASFFSSFISGAQRLPNGNTLICSGAQGRVFEVTPAGKIVWEYLNPHGGDVKPASGGPGGGGIHPNALFRVTRIAPDHPGLKALQN